MQTRSYTVTGMDCAEETEALRRTVGSVPGVTGLSFNLLHGTMTVTADAGAADDAQIVAAGRRAGLAVAPQAAPGAATPRRADRGRALLCGASGVLIGAGVIAHAVTHQGLVHALAGGGGAAHRYPFAAVLCYAAAALAGGWFVLPKALAALRRRQPDMNLLMTLAVAGAMVLGEWLEAASVAFLFSLSLLLESWSVARARRAIQALLDVTPPTARTVSPRGGDLAEVPVAAVAVGATVLVRPGERLPLDGVVSEGATTVNQAPITGEALPVTKAVGDEVYAGTINESGAFAFRVTRPAADTTLSRIIRMVEEAHARRAPAEQWVERFARVYTPAMLLLAAGVAIVPPLLTGGEWHAWFYEALVVLVIACPCALVIATPVSIVSALAAAARTGVLIKGGAFLEAAASLQAIALDKTGTVTRGHPEVRTVLPLTGHTERELLERAAALEAHSNHPLARAILRHAAARELAVPAADDYRILQGKGAEGRVGGRLFWIGSHRLQHERAAESEALHARIEELDAQGCSVVVIGNDTHVCGLIGVADAVRDEAADVIRRLKAAGVGRIVMLTGDNAGTARAVARAVGIDDVRSELLPEEKLRAVEALVRESGATAMVGDGINDAPALAAATLGIAMGAAGSDAAIETADIALMSDDLAKLPWLVGHARATRRVIRQNILFALALKALFMILVLLNLGSLWLAIVADTGATLLVILNALRLLRGADRRRGMTPEMTVRGNQ